METRRTAIEKEAQGNGRRFRLWTLIVMTVVTGAAGLIGTFWPGGSSGPHPFAFGWFVLCAIALACEFVHQRRLASRAAGPRP